MFKRYLFLLISLTFIQTAFAFEPIKAGISFDYEKNTNLETEKINKKITPLEKKFIELNYSVEQKPLNMLSEDELIFKKKTLTPSFIYSNNEIVPDNYEISFSTGKTKGKISEGDKIKSLIKKYPNNKEILFAYSIQLKNENKMEEALDIVNNILDTSPEYALAHFLKGDILRSMEKFKEAVDEYIYTTQLNPYCSDAYYNIAGILELLDDRELAFDYYKIAYQINPNDNDIRDIILEHYIDL